LAEKSFGTKGKDDDAKEEAEAEVIRVKPASLDMQGTRDMRRRRLLTKQMKKMWKWC
jgi:hypothetical protein